MTFKDRQLLEMSFTKSDDFARKVLNLRQKIDNDGTYEDTLKRSKAQNNRARLAVLHACLRCVLAMRPSQVLMDAAEDNTTYIGRFLLHPNFETVELTTSILLEIVKQEKLGNAIGLFLCQLVKQTKHKIVCGLIVECCYHVYLLE